MPAASCTGEQQRFVVCMLGAIIHVHKCAFHLEKQCLLWLTCCVHSHVVCSFASVHQPPSTGSTCWCRQASRHRDVQQWCVQLCAHLLQHSEGDASVSSAMMTMLSAEHLPAGTQWCVARCSHIEHALWLSTALVLLGSCTGACVCAARVWMHFQPECSSTRGNITCASCMV